MTINLPQASTSIEWCDHTANAWWGCTKVHAGCASCYAESLSKRTGHDVWGKDAPRRAIESVWNNLLKWDRAWATQSRRGVVFCSSMCDVFEEHGGSVVNSAGEYMENDRHQRVTIAELRDRLLLGIMHRPNLVHLLLTKRPQNVMRMVPKAWLDHWPTNVMIGTSPCDQATANKCIPELLKIPGPKFLSIEPLLGPIDLCNVGGMDPLWGGTPGGRKLSWTIIGCESQGPRTKRLPGGSAGGFEQAAGSIVAQCETAGVPVFVKQVPGDGGLVEHDLAKFRPELRVRQRPAMLTERGAM